MEEHEEIQMEELEARREQPHRRRILGDAKTLLLMDIALRMYIPYVQVTAR